MKTVTLFSKADCHLCDVAKGVLLNAQKKVPFELHEKKISEGDSDYDTYEARVPVILIDGEFGFQYRVSEQRLLARLKEKA